MAKKKAYDGRALIEATDTYVEGVYAVLALVNHARWDERQRKLDEETPFGIGRRFTTSDGNRIVPPDTVVTPDCAVQFGPALGLIGEAKPGVAKDLTVWEENLRQLEKYDDGLTGWWTDNEKIENHDIVVLVPMSRAVNFVDLVKSRIQDGRVSFRRPLAVVAFFKQTGAEKVFVTLKTEYGELSNGALGERLRQAKPVDWQQLLTRYRDPKFMDYEPPLPYTMWLLWDLMFGPLATGREREAGTNWIPIDIDLRRLTEDCQQYFGQPSSGPRSVEFPRQTWIKRALDAMVAFRLGERVSEAQYRVKYRRRRTNVDMLAYCGELCQRHAKRLGKVDETKPLLDLLDVRAADATPDGAASS
jgi:hypothetical protein